MTPPAPIEQPLPYPTHGAPVQAPPIILLGRYSPIPAQAPVEQTYPTHGALSVQGSPASTGQTLPSQVH